MWLENSTQRRPPPPASQGLPAKLPHKVSTYRGLTSFWTDRFRNNRSTHTRNTHFSPVLGVSFLPWGIGTGVRHSFPGFAQGQGPTLGLFSSISKALQEDSVSGSNISKEAESSSSCPGPALLCQEQRGQDRAEGPKCSPRL